MAHFMKDGEFQRHLRRIRKKFSVKHGIAREALEKRLPEGIFVEDSSSGVHIPLRFERPVRMEELVEKCSAVGLKVRPITEGLLMFNFAILAEDKILEASDKLAELLEESFV